MAIALALVLHAHQPVGNFDHVIEDAFQTSYRPLLAAAQRRPWLRLNLHFSGFLLDWLAARHPGYIAELRALTAAGSLEMLGGGYYEPILPILTVPDQLRQIALLRTAVTRHFGVPPRGMWLAERVWEPELPAVLARAGVEYTLLDDTHFQLAGYPDEELHGYWRTEDQNAFVKVVPSNFFLRQAVPFQPVVASMDYLERAERLHPGSLLTMGDDLEKFGTWPHTFQHVFTDGWLEDFLDGLEARRALITTVRLTDFLDQQPARGLAYLPAASYPEMMAWAAPFQSASPVRAVGWRSFLTKYSESNWLHKAQLDLSTRLAAWRAIAPATLPAPTQLLYDRAYRHLLAAQCNDVYWHGWFGGLYAPHLRNQAFSHLLGAEAELQALSPAPAVRRYDADGDGRDEIELRTATLRAVVAPHDGGCIAELDFLPARANLINGLQRRPESYHQQMRERIAANPGNLPGQPVLPPVAEFERYLRYDTYPRRCGRTLLCPANHTFASFENCALAPDAAAAGGDYQVTHVAPGAIHLSGNSACGAIFKRVTCDSIGALAAQIEVVVTGAEDLPEGARRLQEWVINLLAPDAPDRWFEHAEQRFSLTWTGELAPGPLQLNDGWREFNLTFEAPGASAWWIVPIFSVSQSEAGFERIYQGSSIVAVWPGGHPECLTRLTVRGTAGSEKNEQF